MLVILIIFLVVFAGFSIKLYRKDISPMVIEKRIDEIRHQEDYVTIDDINETFLNAIVAVEDHRFYNHGAIDFISIARAFYENIKNGEIVQGGSTITQQLAKNIFLSNEKTVERKIKEIIISFKLEEEYSKAEILELYVNIIYYGDGYTGISEASKGYFNKNPNELKEDEATLLAGIPQAPSYYELSSNYDKAEIRQQEVIAALNNFKDDVALELKY
nr:biosynthetic peptidoglycan transglycosylase [uncultured Clostridium sp.]